MAYCAMQPPGLPTANLCQAPPHWPEWTHPPAAEEPGASESHRPHLHPGIPANDTSRLEHKKSARDWLQSWRERAERKGALAKLRRRPPPPNRSGPNSRQTYVECHILWHVALRQWE